MLEDLPAVLMVLESVFPSSGGGGAETQVRTLAAEFLRRGQPLRVVVPMVSDGPQVREELLDGIPVTRIPYPKIPRLGALWMLLSLAWLLVTSRRDYRIIHTHIGGNMSAVCSVVGRWLGKPVLVKLTGTTDLQGGILDPQPRLGARLRKRAMRCSSVYQATSQKLADLLVESGFDPRKVLKLPNGVDFGRFADATPDAALRSEVSGNRRLLGIYVGRLEPEKGVELLVEGWARAFAGRSDVALLLVGSGSLRERLHAQAQALGVQQQLIFAGPTDRVERYLVLADFGLLTSQFEGLSNALLEYMAAGLPVVGSRVSGTEDWVIDGRTGWSIPAGDAAALAQALIEVHACDAQELERRGALAQEMVRRQASIPSVVDALQATYRRMERGNA